MTIGNRIKEFRKRLDMSQDELAEKIGANRVTISRYENDGYLPSIPALNRLAKALNTTPSELNGERNTTRQPITEEAQIICGGVDQLPKQQRQQALNVLRALFPENF